MGALVDRLSKQPVQLPGHTSGGVQDDVQVDTVTVIRQPPVGDPRAHIVGKRDQFAPFGRRKTFRHVSRRPFLVDTGNDQHWQVRHGVRIQSGQRIVQGNQRRDGRPRRRRRWPDWARSSRFAARPSRQDAPPHWRRSRSAASCRSHSGRTRRRSARPARSWTAIASAARPSHLRARQRHRHQPWAAAMTIRPCGARLVTSQEMDLAPGPRRAPPVGPGPGRYRARSPRFPAPDHKRPKRLIAAQHDTAHGSTAPTAVHPLGAAPAPSPTPEPVPRPRRAQGQPENSSPTQRL